MSHFFVARFGSVPGLGLGCRGFKSYHSDHIIQVWFNGRTAVSKTVNRGSIPLTCAKNARVMEPVDMSVLETDARWRRGSIPSLAPFFRIFTQTW